MCFFRAGRKPSGRSVGKSNIADIVAIAAINVERSKRLGYANREKSRDSIQVDLCINTQLIDIPGILF